MNLEMISELISEFIFELMSEVTVPSFRSAMPQEIKILTL